MLKTTSNSSWNVTIIGLGEVGIVLAKEMLDRPDVNAVLCSRPSEASRKAAKYLGQVMEEDVATAVAQADIVLLCATAKALAPICKDMTGHLKPGAILADLSASTPEQARASADMLSGDGVNFVDVAIMGAVSIWHARTPMVAAGPRADEFGRIADELGLNIRPMAESAVGDASRLKLARSIFAKGIEGLLVETALAAEAFGLWDELQTQFDNFDKTKMRDHLAMYLRTHLRHAERRHEEMVAAEVQLKSAGIPSLSTAAAIERYRRTSAFLETSDTPPEEVYDNGRLALQWLLDQELSVQAKAGNVKWESADGDI